MAAETFVADYIRLMEILRDEVEPRGFTDRGQEVIEAYIAPGDQFDGLSYQSVKSMDAFVAPPIHTAFIIIGKGDEYNDMLQCIRVRMKIQQVSQLKEMRELLHVIREDVGKLSTVVGDLIALEPPSLVVIAATVVFAAVVTYLVG